MSSLHAKSTCSGFCSEMQSGSALMGPLLPPFLSRLRLSFTGRCMRSRSLRLAPMLSDQVDGTLHCLLLHVSAALTHWLLSSLYLRVWQAAHCPVPGQWVTPTAPFRRCKLARQHPIPHLLSPTAALQVPTPLPMQCPQRWPTAYPTLPHPAPPSTSSHVRRLLCCTKCSLQAACW